MECLGCTVILPFSRSSSFHFGVIRTTVRLRLLSLRRAVWPILAYVFGCALFVLPARTRTLLPLFDCQDYSFRNEFLPRNSFRVYCTLHPDLPRHPHCQRLSIFPLRLCLFRGQFARFHIALHRPARPLSFGQLSCVRILLAMSSQRSKSQI